jgi:hypothetical protein
VYGYDYVYIYIYTHVKLISIYMHYVMLCSQHVLCKHHISPGSLLLPR